MAQTVIAWGDPKAKKAWSTGLAVDQVKKAYFEKKFVGTDENSIIQRKTELESDSGDRVSFDLSVQLRGEATEGDARLEGKEENQKYYTDEVVIDQVRHAVSAGGAMTRKRTNLNLRGNARRLLSDYWARFNDEMMFIYLSGARGINKDFLFSLDWQGRAGNPIQAPDAGHLIYGGAATSKATLTANDKMTRIVIEKAATKATMLQAQDPESANMVPVSIDGEEHYVCVMNPFQEHDLRTSEGSGWIDVQKAAAAAEGKANPIFKGGLGMIKNVVLHSHRNSIRFSDYGAGSNVDAGRALFMGRQAGVVAYGTSGGMRWDWKEETKDYGNEPTVASGAIFGFKKARFNGRDFGVLSIDTAAKDPNA
jgi:N4-gp56 family major capsid protein